MALYNILSGSLPLASDLQQVIDALTGKNDIGPISFVVPQTAPGTVPTITVNAVAGNLNGAYSYKVTFVTGYVKTDNTMVVQGETLPSAASSSVSPVNKQINLTAIPLGPTGTIARRLYRTTGGGVIYKLVTQINNNTSTTYTDNLADGGLGAAVPSSNTTGTSFISPLISKVATGTAPFQVASTTLVNNLNADLLDGQHAGNASGQVPLSNGTLNVNLNADLLDGLHAAAFQTALGFSPVNKAGDTMTGNLTAPDIYWGSQGTRTVNTSDFNAISKSGFYDGQNATGAPTAGSWYFLIHSAHSANGPLWGVQIAQAFDDNNGTYIRTSMDAGGGVKSWSPWKRLWHSGNDGAGSGLDADTVRGRDIIADLDRNYYDDYLRQLELYYTGHFSGPEITGQKGMTFDCFQDTNRVNTGTTTALVDTVGKVVKCADTAYVKPVSATDAIASNNTGLTSNTSWQSGPDLGNMVDGYTTGSVEWSNSTTANYLVAKLDLGSVKPVSGIRFYQRGSASHMISRISYSSDNVNYTVVDIPDLYFTPSVLQWIERTFAEVNARYIAFEVYEANGVDEIYEVQVISKYAQKVVQSTTKTLESNAVAATLYLSVKEPAGTSVTPVLSADNGAHFETPTLVSSKADPLDATYTEKKYSLTFANAGSNLILKSTLNPSSDGLSTPEIKRYAIHWS